MKRGFRYGVLCAGTLLTLLFSGALAPPLRAQSPTVLYNMGQDAEAKDNVIEAYNDYLQAWQKQPKNLRWKASYERLRFEAAAAYIKLGQQARDRGDINGALTSFLQALQIDPSNAAAQQEIQRTKDGLNNPAPNQNSSLQAKVPDELAAATGPLELKAVSNDPITLHLVEDSKVIYQTIGKLAGINVIFDPDYVSKRIPLELNNVSLSDALHIVGTLAGTFYRPVTPNTIFVAQNVPQKRSELETQAVQTFYLANVAQQNDIQDITNGLRQLLVGNDVNTVKIFPVPAQNAIVMRGTPDQLLLAQKLIDDLDKARSEVVIDIAVMQVNKDKLRNIGVQFPGSVGVTLQPPATQTTTTTGTTSGTTTGTTGTTTTSTGNGLNLNNLAHLNATNFAVNIGQITANLLLSDSNTKILQNPQIRATDSQEATLKIGQRIPVASSSYQAGASTAVVSSLVNTQFQYIDVGVNITLTPLVHYNHDVTLKLKIEVSSEDNTVNLGGISEPVIGQRTIQQVIRLKEGEVNLLGGILQKEDLVTVGGTPGLGEIPILKYLFSSQQHEVVDNEIVFMLVPHVVRSQQLSPLNTRVLDTGTQRSVELRRGPAASALTAQPVVPASPPQPTAPPPVQPAAPPSVAPNAKPSAAIPAQPENTSPPLPAGPAVALALTPSDATQKQGSSFKVSVNLSGGRDIFSVPMQLQYDQGKLTLINVDTGDLLGKDGQAIALVHRDDGNGGLVLTASRPPNTQGINGDGTVCTLTFQAKAPGDAVVAITKPGARNSQQQSLPVSGSQAVIHVQ